MTQISNSLDELRQRKEAEIDEIVFTQKSRRPYAHISWESFITIFKKNLEISMKKRNVFNDFVFDDNNKKIINQLFYHLTMNAKFEGNLYKGIYLYGKSGRGKSTILEAYSLTITDFTQKIISDVPAKNIADTVTKFGYSFFDRRPVRIEDLGREVKELNIFGVKTIPMVEILHRREISGAFTLASAQVLIDNIRFSYWSDGEQIKGTYGDATIRRAKALMNEIELTGPDRTA